MEHTLQQFILEHQDSDTTKLLLARKKWPEIDVDLAVNTIEGRRRIAPKVPSWGERKDLLYPTRLCTEQCSSTATALYKAGIVSRLFQGNKPKIADLTGGLGVDSWHLASVSSELLHNEADALLSSCVEQNFKTMVPDSAVPLASFLFSSSLIEPGNVREVLGGFCPDLMFMDPARRSDSGKKVFLIEDCRPDVINLMDEIFEISRYLFVKLSPMADITMVTQRLRHVTEVHTVATGGECKELLILMDRESQDEGYRLFVHDNGNTMEFSPSEEKTAVPRFPSKDSSLEGVVLFEPGKALAKAGLFNCLCERFGMVKLGRSTNLYLAGNGLLDETDCQVPGSILDFGKCFRIKVAMPLDNKSVKECGKRIGWADVTARNIPMTSEALAKKMGLNAKNATAKASDVPHIFGVRVDFRDSKSDNLLLVTEKI